MPTAECLYGQIRALVVELIYAGARIIHVQPAGIHDQLPCRIHVYVRAIHRARRDVGWVVLEEPLHLARALADAGDRPVLVDCLTVWLSNLMLADRDIAAATETLDAALVRRGAPTVLVSNEVGLGIVPDNALARAFRDAAGRLNQHFAARADTVLFLVAGLPMRVK